MLGLGLTKTLPYVIYIGALLIMVISLRKPKIGLYFLIFLIPFRVLFDKIEQFPLGKDINDLLFLSIILGWFITTRDEYSKIFTKNSLNKYVILMIVFSFFSLIFGSFYWGLENPLDPNSVRFIHWKNYAMLPILYLMSVNLIKTKKEMIIAVLLMIMALFLADVHYFQNMRYRNLSFYREDLRTGGIFTNLGGNELAAFHAHFLFLPLGLLLYEKKGILKILYAVIILFTLYPIAFIFSRGAYLAVLTGSLFLGTKRNKIIILLIIIIIFSWNIVLPKGVVDRIQMTKTHNELDHSSAVRLDYWKRGFEQFLRNPILGVGFDTTKYFSQNELHNAYVEILAEQGIIGLWIFLALLYSTFRNGIWLQRNANDDFIKGLGLATGGVVVACATTNLFGDRWTYMELSAFFFVLMALVMNAKGLVEKERIKI